MEGIATPFCPRCGKAVPAGSIFCNYCGVPLPTERELTVVEPPEDWAPTPPSQAYAPSSTAGPRRTGSIGLGVLAGFLLLTLLGFIPIIGALVAGLVAGLIARGACRGALAGFIAGILGSVVLTFLLTAFGGALGGILGGLFGGLIGSTVILLTLGSAILCLIGGLIGGALRRE
jgi:uncharacterized membrane protein YeaQ/YmgE (transglycosylase-associated protein family)